MFASIVRSLRSAIHRDAFLYMEPAPGDPQAAQFAQCGTCRDWTGLGCRILGRHVTVLAGDSCGLYVRGRPRLEDAGLEEPLVSEEAAGFVRAQVRCQNCRFASAPVGSRGTCRLFAQLGLDADVALLGCCNGWVRKPGLTG